MVITNKLKELVKEFEEKASQDETKRLMTLARGESKRLSV